MRTLLITLAVLAMPAAAGAQVCPYGLVAVDAAHCCWPGQSYAPERGTCAGVPQCPAGLSPFGETCIVSQAAPQAQPAALPPPPAPEAQPVPPPPPPPTAGYTPAPAPAYAPVPGQVFGVQVRFEAKHEGQDFMVTVDKGTACRVPCEMTLPPGRHRVRVEGDASFREDLNFPAGPSVVQIEKKKGGMVALGVVGLAVGIPAAVIGGICGLTGLALSNSDLYDDNSHRKLMYGGFIVMAAGITFAAVGAGVGFGTAGHNRARFARADADDASAPPLQLLSLGAMPTRDGGAVGATFAF